MITELIDRQLAEEIRKRYEDYTQNPDAEVFMLGDEIHAYDKRGLMYLVSFEVGMLNKKTGEFKRAIKFTLRKPANDVLARFGVE
jgi:hypothetical protein